MHAKGIRFGMFFNSDRGGNLSDKAFYTQSLLSYKEFTANFGKVDDILIESWYPYPLALIPEDQPYTFMNLAKKMIAQLR